RPAKRRDLRVGVRTEVPHPAAQWPAGERISADVLLQRLALAPVARRLGAGHALLQDRLALTPFHVASVPAAGGAKTSRARSNPESSIRSAKRGGSSRWPRSASTRTRCCGWRRGR